MASMRSLMPSARRCACDFERDVARGVVVAAELAPVRERHFRSGRPRAAASAARPKRGSLRGDLHRQRLVREQLAIAGDGQRVVVEVEAVHGVVRCSWGSSRWSPRCIADRAAVPRARCLRRDPRRASSSAVSLPAAPACRRRRPRASRRPGFGAGPASWLWRRGAGVRGGRRRIRGRGGIHRQRGHGPMRTGVLSIAVVAAIAATAGETDGEQTEDDVTHVRSPIPARRNARRGSRSRRWRRRRLRATGNAARPWSTVRQFEPR